MVVSLKIPFSLPHLFVNITQVLLMVPFLTPSGPVVSRLRATNTTNLSQQHPLGMQAAAMGPSVSYQNMSFSPVGYAPPVGNIPARYGSHLQGYTGEESGFNQGYFRSMQDANVGNRLNPDMQDNMRQRDRML